MEKDGREERRRRGEPTTTVLVSTLCAVEPLQGRLAGPLFRSLAFLPKAPILTNEGNSSESTGKKKESDILILPRSEYNQTQE